MLSKSMMIGTVFEEEEVASKKNFYNLAVLSPSLPIIKLPRLVMKEEKSSSMEASQVFSLEI